MRSFTFRTTHGSVARHVLRAITKRNQRGAVGYEGDKSSSDSWHEEEDFGREANWADTGVNERKNKKATNPGLWFMVQLRPAASRGYSEALLHILQRRSPSPQMQ